MAVMNAAFEQAESRDGMASRERSEERLRDEDAWLSMEDEGCPNVRQLPGQATGDHQAALWNSGRMHLSTGREESSI